jgi:spore coat protein A, manganese oxidase
MKGRIIMIMTGIILLVGGIAGAQTNLQQVLLPGSLIPKFVDQLPVAGDISVVDATSTGALYNPNYVPPAPITPQVAGGSPYNIHLKEFQAQILPSTGVPPDPATGFLGLTPNTASWVWGYLTDTDLAAQPAVRPSFLGPVVLAERGVPAYPTYLNELPVYPAGNVQAILPIDQTIDWANPLNTDPMFNANGDWTNPVVGTLPYAGPLPDSVHIHGGEVPPASDGGPDSWFTQANSVTGLGFSGNTLEYPNGQEEATIWFHPHGFGITRLNVFAGMAGVYPIVDAGGPSAPLATMPAFPQHDVPLIIQDRTFDQNGQIFYNLGSNPQPNPTVHPFWIPEFIGDVICVNGKTWPNLNVEPRQYRFRLLNGSNARFYDLTLSNGAPFFAIATDAGYLVNAVSTPNVIIAPGERYEVIVDFTGLAVGTQVIMMNSANTPFPGGGPVNPGTTDTVMRFTVVADTSGLPNTTVANGTPIRPSALAPILSAHNPATGSITRQLTLNEVIGAGGPLELVMNNSKYNLKSNDPAVQARPIPVLPGCTTPLCRETELPAVGDTEIWEIINISADAHPVHTHLVTFQLLDRTAFDSATWITQYDALLLANGVPAGGGPPNQYNIQNADGAIGGNPAINALLQLNNRTLPLPYERGWKDTVIAYPGQVTRIAVRWAPQDAPATGAGAPIAGTNLYPFDPSALVGGVGYVWHCHILDHEDNEMMRTYTVGDARQPVQGLANFDLLYASFPTGIYQWKNGVLRRIRATVPTDMVASGSVLYANLANGIWKWDGTAWKRIHTRVASSMVASDTGLYVNFTGFGLYEWDGMAWKRIRTSVASSMVASGTNLYATFANGLYQWDGVAWKRIRTVVPSSMVASGMNLYATFANGLYQWDGMVWKRIHTRVASNMVASGTNLYVSFPVGLYRWDGIAWKRINPNVPAAMVASGMNLYADFGATGLFRWDGMAWTQINLTVPVGMVAAGPILYADFGASGLSKWEANQWSLIDAADPALMVAGF